jgi:sporulation protein YlmC with PRC-barrel domain
MIKANEIVNYKLAHKGKKIGKIKDVFFDDKTDDVRYLAVRVGGFLLGREVLLPPQAVKGVDAQAERVSTRLTKKELKKGPGLDSRKPVSRQKEIELFKFYNWTPYWLSGGASHATGQTAPPPPAAVKPPEEEVAENEEPTPEIENADPHLRSYREIEGYKVISPEGKVGEVDDAIIDEEEWKTTHFVVDAGSWIAYRRYLVAFRWLEAIDWDRSEVVVALAKDKIKSAPSYDPAKPITEGYLKIVAEHYDN